MAERKAAAPLKSTQKFIKSVFKKAKSTLPLKVFIRTATDPEVLEAGKAWLRNKRANFSRPPLGLGSTRKKKGGPGGKK